MKYPFLHERKRNLCTTQWYISFFFQFGLRLNSNLVIAQSLGYIVIFQSSDFLCKSYERRVFILDKLLIAMRSQMTIN